MRRLRKNDRDDKMTLSVILVLLLISIFAGAYGTIIGAGGGFIFVPFLLILFGLEPRIAAGSGLVIVMINAIIGAIGYTKQKKIAFNQGITIGVSAIPGTFIGSWLLQHYFSNAFYIIFAILLSVLGFFLLFKNLPIKFNKKKPAHTSTASPSFNYWYIPLGFLMGVISNYLGIGGGWLLVPVLIYVFKMPPKEATSTSVFSLLIYTTVGAITQISIGNLNWMIVIIGGIGIAIGAKIGLKIAEFIPERRIMQLLSAVLIIMGIRMFFM